MYAEYLLLPYGQSTMILEVKDGKKIPNFFHSPFIYL